jgi:hypothetical protein
MMKRSTLHRNSVAVIGKVRHPETEAWAKSRFFGASHLEAPKNWRSTQVVSGVAGAFVLLAQLSVLGCASSPTGDEGTAGTGATGGSATGATGGSSGSGTSGTGGSGGTGTAGTGTSGECAATGTWVAPPIAPPECTGIKTGEACPTEGTHCEPLVCGLADTGRRTCDCTGLIWTCTPCDFTESPFKDRLECTPACTGAEVDKAGCTVQGAVCDGATGGEACACWPDDESDLIWDCDKPPSSW